jgi:hypothetical protein
MAGIYHPDIVHILRDAANTMYPAVQLYGRSVAAENYLMARQHKTWLARRWRFGLGTAGVAGTTSLMHFRRRSSIGVTRLQAVFIIGRTLASGAASPPNPGVQLDVTIAGGATTTIGPIRYGLTNVTPTDAPEEWFITLREIAISEETDYECVVKTVDYGRILGIAVRELGDQTIDPALDWWNGFIAQAEAPIYDVTREDLLRGMSEMWRANAGGGMDFARDGGTARTRTSATYANLFDGATTGTPTNATRGFYLDNTYRRRYSKSTVRYKLAVRGSIPGAGSGNVKLMDTAGNSYGPVNITSAVEGWGTGDVDLVNDGRKYDLQYAGDNANLFSVKAVSLYELDL